MSFLTIPGQENLFTTIKPAKASDPEEEDEEDEEDEEENVRLIPRCSPVPRKRGSSIHDETAEYMRIHRALSAGKRVSFADTTGGELVDVKEFVAFDSDDESERWDEEQAKYRRPDLVPTYNVHPEFISPSSSSLLQAVHTNKVELEKLSTVDGEPLAFTGTVRVLNISFNKAVYIRSTMDSWTTYFDHPAEYVDGSCDGDTDQFSFKMSFAAPFTTHGSRIEFVIRYETSDGDFWANNSSLNYTVTLHLTYEEDAKQSNTHVEQIKGILRPPKAYSDVDDFDSEDEEEKEKEPSPRPFAERPADMDSEMDVEQVEEILSRPIALTDQETPPIDGATSASTEGHCETPENKLDSAQSLELPSEFNSHTSDLNTFTAAPTSSCLNEGNSPEDVQDGEEKVWAPDVASVEVDEHVDSIGIVFPTKDLMQIFEASEESPPNDYNDITRLFPEVESIENSPSAPPDEPPPHTLLLDNRQEDAAEITRHAIVENPPESYFSIHLLPSVYMLGGVIFLTTVVQEPSTLFLTALLLVLHRL